MEWVAGFMFGIVVGAIMAWLLALALIFDKVIE